MNNLPSTLNIYEKYRVQGPCKDHVLSLSTVLNVYVKNLQINYYTSKTPNQRKSNRPLM